MKKALKTPFIKPGYPDPNYCLRFDAGYLSGATSGIDYSYYLRFKAKGGYLFERTFYFDASDRLICHIKTGYIKINGFKKYKIVTFYKDDEIISRTTKIFNNGIGDEYSGGRMKKSFNG